MRIDLPCCNLKTCIYCQDHNCTNKQIYSTCNYAKSNRIIEEVSSFLYQHDITCPEDIYQRESVLEEASELTARLVEIMIEEKLC